jgi:hypothetical protein
VSVTSLLHLQQQLQQQQPSAAVAFGSSGALGESWEEDADRLLQWTESLPQEVDPF